MGLAPDNTAQRNPFASGSRWKPMYATEPVPYTQFKPDRNRADPMFEQTFRQAARALQTEEQRRAGAAREATMRSLERQMAVQERKILGLQEQRKAMVAQAQLKRQRKLSAGGQRREQRRFDSDVAYNAVKNPPDRLVEVRSPPIMMVCGKMDGSSVGWWAPRPQSAAPLREREWTAPYSPMMHGSTRALPRAALQRPASAPHY